MGANDNITLADTRWELANPTDTQLPGCTHVPSVPGLYLWLRNDSPGPGMAPTTDVLYVGQTKDLAGRLHRYSTTTYTREDPVLHSLFDRVIAPNLPARAVKDIVVNRAGPLVAQMWIRDHVVFAWTRWDGPGRIAEENRLRAVLAPWFNSSKDWTRYGSTSHEVHDITLPLAPRPIWSPS